MACPVCGTVALTTAFRVVGESGEEFGVYRAPTVRAALDLFAREAGYRDNAHATADVGAFGGTVEPVSSVCELCSNGSEVQLM